MNQPMDCDAQLAETCLFAHTFFWRAILTHEVCHADLARLRKITSLCVQRLRFVPPWLTSRHTHTETHIHRHRHTHRPAYMKSSASWA